MMPRRREKSRPAAGGRKLADAQTTSPWRIVFSVTARGSTNCEQVVRAAGLRPGARQAVAAERLAADHRAGDPAVDVQVADRGAVARRTGRSPGRARTGRRSARTAARRRRRRRGRRRARARRPAAGRRSPRRAPASPPAGRRRRVGGQNQPLLGHAVARGRRSRPSRAADARRSARRAPGRPRSITGGTSVPSVCGLADHQHLHRARQALEQLVGDRLVDEHPRGRRALLAGVGERRADDRRDRLVEVGVGVDDHAVLAAELGDDALEVALARSRSRRPRGRSRARPAASR